MASDSAPKPNKWADLIADLIKPLPYIGKLESFIRRMPVGALAALLAFAWLFVIYPLLLPGLSAGLINMGLLSSWHEPYARQVRKAFHAEEFATEMATKSNKLIDYFQVVDFFSPVSEPPDYTLSAASNQFIRIRAENATVFSEDDKKCALPRSWNRVGKAGAVGAGRKIYTIEIAGQQVGDIRQNPKGEPITLNSTQWEAITRNSEPGRITVRLLPVAELADLQCSQVKAEVRLTFEVFKDLIPPLASAGAVK